MNPGIGCSSSVSRLVLVSSVVFRRHTERCLPGPALRLDQDLVPGLRSALNDRAGFGAGFGCGLRGLLRDAGFGARCRFVSGRCLETEARSSKGQEVCSKMWASRSQCLFAESERSAQNKLPLGECPS